MFLDDITYKNNHFLSEAENDEEVKKEDEPMEEDSNMDLKNDETQNNDEDNESSNDENSSNMEDIPSDDIDGEDSSTNDESSGDIGSSSTTDISEINKKRALYRDYKDLMEITNDLMNAISTIPYENLSDDTKKIFNFIEIKMKENYEKLRIIMTEQYNILKYKDLMKLYLFLKMSIKSYNDLIKYFVLYTEE